MLKMNIENARLSSQYFAIFPSIFPQKSIAGIIPTCVFFSIYKTFHLVRAFLKLAHWASLLCDFFFRLVTMFLQQNETHMLVSDSECTAFHFLRQISTKPDIHPLESYWDCDTQLHHTHKYQQLPQIHDHMHRI